MYLKKPSWLCWNLRRKFYDHVTLYLVIFSLFLINNKKLLSPLLLYFLSCSSITHFPFGTKWKKGENKKQMKNKRDKRMASLKDNTGNGRGTHVVLSLTWDLPFRYDKAWWHPARIDYHIWRFWETINQCHWGQVKGEDIRALVCP